MREKDDEMAHHSIVAKTAYAGNDGANSQFVRDTSDHALRELSGRRIPQVRVEFRLKLEDRRMGKSMNVLI